MAINYVRFVGTKTWRNETNIVAPRYTKNTENNVKYRLNMDIYVYS